MYRLDDWECAECGAIRESLEDDSARKAREAVIDCDECGEATRHEWRMSMPAPYTGEQVRNPICHGGEFDTVGKEKPPRLPEFQAHQEHTRKLTAAIAQLPDNASDKEIRAVHREVGKDAPSMADWRSHISKPEWKETKAERDQVKKRNKVKRERLAALKAGGTVNMRRDKVAGDPKI